MSTVQRFLPWPEEQGPPEGWPVEYVDAEVCEDAALFLDTALSIITELELHAEGILPRPPSVVPSPWFDGAKDLVHQLGHAEARPDPSPETSDKPGAKEGER